MATYHNNICTNAHNKQIVWRDIIVGERDHLSLWIDASDPGHGVRRD